MTKTLEGNRDDGYSIFEFEEAFDEIERHANKDHGPGNVAILNVGRYATGLEHGLYRRAHAPIDIGLRVLRREMPIIHTRPMPRDEQIERGRDNLN